MKHACCCVPLIQRQAVGILHIETWGRHKKVCNVSPGSTLLSLFSDGGLFDPDNVEQKIPEPCIPARDFSMQHLKYRGF